MSRRALIVAMVALRVAHAQAVPPPGIRAEDGADLLERAREKVLVTTHRLPKYTCLETINRTYYVLPPEKHSRNMMTEAPADACIANRSGQLSLSAKDRLRMEVAAAGEAEIHSWPGASRFDTRCIDQMIPFGPVSTGSFGTYLLEIFVNPGKQIRFTGTKSYGPRDVFVYSFRVLPKASRFLVKASRIWRVTGVRGSLEINAATADLARWSSKPIHSRPIRICASRRPRSTTITC